MKVALGAATLVTLAISAGSAHAQAVEKGSLGVGLIIGEPTGISAKLYLDDDNAVQAAAGSAFVGGGLQVHADYLWHPWILEERDSFTLPAYVGPGARFIYYQQGRDGDDFSAVGARAVAGIVFDFKEIPLDVFVEVAGVVEWRFAPTEEEKGFALTLNAGLGARYYF
jgi:hypothetical protein